MSSGLISHSKRISVAGAAIAFALALTSCSSSVAGQSGASGESGKGTPEPPKIELSEYFVQPTGIEVDGLTGQRISSTTGSAARWSYLPGEQPFNALLAEVVGAQLQAQAQTREATYVPEAHDQSEDWLNRGCISGTTALSGREILDNPELSLTPGSDTVLSIACDTVLAAGTTYGQQLRFVRGTASEVTSDQLEIIYTDTATGEVSRGRDLISPDALPALYDALLELKKIDGPMSGDEPVPPSSETLADLGASLSNIGFDDQGNIYVTVDANLVAFLAAGDPEVEVDSTTLKIPANSADSVLTPLGASISHAKAESLAWSGPAALPSGREYVDCNLVPCVAVTYDDGPSSYTPDVVAAFAAQPYAATTFFVLGQGIVGQEEIVKAAYDAGNEIANHSWSHPPLTTLDDASIKEELDSTTAQITAVTGSPVTTFRPPYGDYDDRVLAVAGLPAILWSVDTNDWQHPGYDALVQQAVWNSEPDGIVLLHDIHQESVAATPAIVEGLLQRGFTLVTVSQLFHGRSLEVKGYWGAGEQPY